MSSLIFVPFWLRVFSISVLSLLLVSGIFFTFYYIEMEGMTDWILVSITSSQVAASGLTAVLLIMYSSRSISTGGLESRTEKFLAESVPAKIKKTPSANDGDPWVVNVSIIERSSILYGYKVVVKNGDEEFGMTFSMLLNVKRLAVYIFVDAETIDSESIKKKIEYTVNISENVGYKCSLNTSYEERFCKTAHMVAFVHESIGEDFLTNSYSQLFFLNDVMMLIRSFLLLEGRGEIKLL